MRSNVLLSITFPTFLFLNLILMQTASADMGGGGILLFVGFIFLFSVGIVIAAIALLAWLIIRSIKRKNLNK